jgi:hypothetical protein
VRFSAIAVILLSILGAGYLYYTQNQGVTLARAETISERYLDSLQTDDFEISEIMEFEYNYYVIYSEHETGIGAFEMLIDKDTGQIFPEYGPNMMWTLKYGHGGMMSQPGGMMGQGGMMGGYLPQGFDSEVLGEEEALEIAQGFLDQVYPGSQADDPHPFYGYYTIHTTKNGEISGMLSVNSLTGAVWYHSWHGDYIQSIESH